MILREYVDKDTQNKNRLFVEVECDHCHTNFSRQKRLLKEIHACSRKCLEILKGSSVFVECAHCGKEVNKRKSDINKSKSGLQFCNRACKEAAQKYMTEIMPDHYGTGNGISSYRVRALEFYGTSCNRCGYNDNVAALQVHHVDRNRSNNGLENLEVLCANCHCIEHLGELED